MRTTNSQTKAGETQFLSLKPIVKRIEQYFNTYEGQEGAYIMSVETDNTLEEMCL